MISIFDTRKQEIWIGHEVVYLPKLDVIQDIHMVTVRTKGMEVSKVKDIRELPGTGWAEIGNTIEVELEDGTILKGDAENGGWGCLKLSA
jgi:hypothetical protein